MDLRNVVVITNRNICFKYNGGKSSSFVLLEQIERLCRYNPEFIVLREKDMPTDKYKSLFLDALKICEAAGVKLLIHNFIDMALEMGYRDIHMPLHKLDEWAKQSNKKDFRLYIRSEFDTIGVSVHNPDDLKLAQELGATYVTFGHVFATECKKGLPPRGTELLGDICKSSKVPVYAIGGINFDNLQYVTSLGASGGCMMSALMKRGNLF